MKKCKNCHINDARYICLGCSREFCTRCMKEDEIICFQCKYNNNKQQENKNKNKNKTQQQEEETEKEEKDYNKVAEDAREQVDPRLLASYERIRKNYRNGLSVVPIVRDACGGCFNAIPPQRQSEIRQRKKIIVCENCGRILVDEDLNESVRAK